MDVGQWPTGVAANPDGTTVYVANSGSNNVYVIDTARNNVIATVNVGNLPAGVAVAPDGKKVYVSIDNPGWYLHIGDVNVTSQKDRRFTEELKKPSKLNLPQALLHLWGRPLCSLRIPNSLEDVQLLPFFLL